MNEDKGGSFVVTSKKSGTARTLLNLMSPRNLKQRSDSFCSPLSSEERYRRYQDFSDMVLPETVNLFKRYLQSTQESMDISNAIADSFERTSLTLSPSKVAIDLQNMANQIRFLEQSRKPYVTAISNFLSVITLRIEVDQAKIHGIHKMYKKTKTHKYHSTGSPLSTSLNSSPPNFLNFQPSPSLDRHFDGSHSPDINHHYHSNPNSPSNSEAGTDKVLQLSDELHSSLTHIFKEVVGSWSTVMLSFSKYVHGCGEKIKDEKYDEKWLEVAQDENNAAAVSGTPQRRVSITSPNSASPTRWTSQVAYSDGTVSASSTPRKREEGHSPHDVNTSPVAIPKKKSSKMKEKTGMNSPRKESSPRKKKKKDEGMMLERPDRKKKGNSVLELTEPLPLQNKESQVNKIPKLSFKEVENELEAEGKGGKSIEEILEKNSNNNNNSNSNSNSNNNSDNKQEVSQQVKPPRVYADGGSDDDWTESEIPSDFEK
eukprot:TRINITY_DN927_c6_g1_i1.p1 TRINITY_DN927_c6_g1~~TRINITY_DN927_c6_g1_i1.p1  ORF type:complete len:485 (+),score=99.86 TRINITY_DN927_c6_g1_i1:213-1667(+)